MNIEFTEAELKTIYLTLTSFVNFKEFDLDSQIETLRTGFYLETGVMFNDEEIKIHIQNSIELGKKAEIVRGKIESYFDIMNINYDFLK